MPGACPPGPDAQTKSRIASERDLNARAAWRTEIADIAPETLVFLDETSTQTVMTRRYGRAPGGARVIGAVPRNHGPNVTCLVAISAAGVHAPCVFEGALNGVLFVRWVREWLVPTLRPGMTVVLDSLSVHKHAEVRTAIEAAGCQLRFLPAYSPDVNPIALAFAKLKPHLRAVAARAFDPLVDAIGTGLTAITTTDIAGFYRHCGYPLPPPLRLPTPTTTSLKFALGKTDCVPSAQHGTDGLVAHAEVGGQGAAGRHPPTLGRLFGRELARAQRVAGRPAGAPGGRAMGALS